MSDAPTILVAGGAGFIGAQTALAFKNRHPDARVIALDNLKRRGSELNLRRLAAGGVVFMHGDIRMPEDLDNLGPVRLIIECSAEPSVLAGYGESPRYVLDANLVGATHCLELARRHEADMIFLSTSRVYPIERLRAIAVKELETRFAIAVEQPLPGISMAGIAEDFPLDGARSLYGATKYAVELLIAEYAAMYGLRCIVNRCGVIAGPWQMGRVDQGVLALWVARHLYGGPLAYIGFGGSGKQVRDMLHVDDLVALLTSQADNIDALSGRCFNVGGGSERAVSLRELTRLCREATGKTIDIASQPENRDADIPLYISDNRRVMNACGWQPHKSMAQIVEDVARWMRDYESLLRPVLSGA